MANLTKEQLLLEYVKCMKDTPYALKTYLQTYDNTVQKYVPLELFPDQMSLLEDYENYNENIALKYRQAGVSTVTAAWLSKKLVFAKKEKPEKVLIIANKLDTSQEMANKVRSFVSQWPAWAWSLSIDATSTDVGRQALAAAETEIAAIADRHAVTLQQVTSWEVEVLVSEARSGDINDTASLLSLGEAIHRG